MISFSRTMFASKDRETNRLICETVSSADEYEQICKTTQSCYEVIPFDIPVCLYADIDCKHPFGECVFDQDHTQIFIDYAERAIACNLSIKPRFAIAISSCPDYTNCDNKRYMCHSIHVHVTNVKMLKSDQKLFWKRMNEFMNTSPDFKDWNEYIEIKSGKFFDEAVYNNDRMLRSVHSSKPRESRPLVLVKGTFRDTVVSLGDSDAVTLVEDKDVKEKEKEKEKEDPTYALIEELAEIIDDRFICIPGCYNDWRNIVWALKSESNLYKTIAMRLSKRDLKFYDNLRFHQLWDSYKTGFLTISTFYHYAKLSNEPLFRQIMAKYQPPLFISVENLHDIFKCAEVISATLKTTLILCKERWWVLNEKQLWREIKEPIFYIVQEIRKYIDYSQNKNSLEIKLALNGEKDRLIQVGKEYLKCYEKINQASYASICKQFLRKHLVDDSFENKLDKNSGFLAFQNGVLDLQTGTFRHGIQWDDFLSDTIQYDWTPHDPAKMQYLKQVLLKILNNNAEHLDYYLSVIAFSFIGRPHLDKSIYFMIDGTSNGRGDNGKTFFFDILDSLMPCYVYKSKGSLLEEGNAKLHKQLCMTKAKRLVWLDEFSKTKKTNPVLLKEIADGKTIENEVMFGTSDKIQILYKMFILSNHIPKVDPNEEAVYNRYKQVSFGSHFDRTGVRKLENPTELLFIADPGLSDTIKNDYYNEVFGIICEYAQKYFVDGGLRIPLQFLNDAKETKDKNDEFVLWFSDNCIQDLSGRISLDVMCEMSSFQKDFIKDGMKRMGFKYNKDLKGVGKDKFGKFYKGGFEGCSL
jgi:hypothetical protein